MENKQLTTKEVIHHIQNFLFSYRNTPSTVTNECPANMLLKQPPRNLLSQIRPQFGQALQKQSKPMGYNNSYLFTTGEKVVVKLNTKPLEHATIKEPISCNRYMVTHNGITKTVHKQQMKKFLEAEKDDPPSSKNGEEEVSPTTASPIIRRGLRLRRKPDRL